MIRTLNLVFWRSLEIATYLVAAPVLIITCLIALVVGGLLGGLVGLLLIQILFEPHAGQTFGDLLVMIPCICAGALFSVTIWMDQTGILSYLTSRKRDTHGSARFAGKRELQALEQATGLLIGRNPKTGRLLCYDGPAHLITLAPTRAGKGVGTVIPNLLAAERSVLVIDPKGENARIAGDARRHFGPVHILDPFGVSDTGKTSGIPSAAYNPLDRLTPDSLDLGEDAASLADALVMDPPGQVSEAHWNEEAKALLGGLILFCVCHEDPDRRSLATVREYLTLPSSPMPGCSRSLE